MSKNQTGGEPITVGEIARLTGYSVRQIQNLAKSGFLPGSRLSEDGYHRVYQWTPELAQWIEQVRKPRHKRGKNPKDPSQRVNALLRTLERIEGGDCQSVPTDTLALLWEQLDFAVKEVERRLAEDASGDRGKEVKPGGQVFRSWLEDHLTSLEWYQGVTRRV